MFDIGSAHGVIVVILRDRDRKQIAESCVSFFKKLGNKDSKGKLYIIDGDRVRIRRAKDRKE